MHCYKFKRFKLLVLGSEQAHAAIHTGCTLNRNEHFVLSNNSSIFLFNTIKFELVICIPVV